MDFIENLRQWTSEQADKLTGQDNTYHRSSGKTQKEYEQDIDFYKNLEDAVRKSAVVLGALDGAVASGGAAAAAGAPLLMTIPEVAANAWMGHFVPWMGAAIQKGFDNARNGGSPKAQWELEYERRRRQREEEDDY